MLADIGDLGDILNAFESVQDSCDRGDLYKNKQHQTSELVHLSSSTENVYSQIIDKLVTNNLPIINIRSPLGLDVITIIFKHDDVITFIFKHQSHFKQS